MLLRFVKYCLLLGCLLNCSDHFSQQLPEPIARYSFDGGGFKDDITGHKAKLIGIKHTSDRFGNENNAVFTFGNPASYVNLGNYPEIKLSVGTIAMWVKIEAPIWSGQGHVMNPFIITKHWKHDDFYESYVMCYYPEQEKVATWCSKDSTKQIGVVSVERFTQNVWHHVAIAYDDNTFSFYVDGKLISSLVKNFKTKFLDSDSVLVGITGNKKNDRYLHASVDDIVFYNSVLNEEQIDTLYNAPNPNRFMIVFNWVIKLSCGILILLVIYLLVRFQLNRKMHREKIRLELQTKLLETELRVNRALMNPHFIFNSLNAIQNLILNNANEKANDYLLKFSKLIRKLLESNISESISLEIEIDILTRYLEIESLRFNEDLQHTIHVDAGLHLGSSKIPIMMVQPFVENAVWHGLMNKSGEKRINISFAPHGETCVECIVEDNGVGRRVSANILMEKKPLATVFALTRLDLINKMHGLNCSIHIEDKPNYSGTIVKLILPLYNKLST